MLSCGPFDVGGPADMLSRPAAAPGIMGRMLCDTALSRKFFCDSARVESGVFRRSRSPYAQKGWTVRDSQCSVSNS